MIFAEDKHNSLINVCSGISPDIRGIPRISSFNLRHYNYFFGVSFPVPRLKNLRFGLGGIQASWTSYKLYKFEKYLLDHDQEVGRTDNLHRHLLDGPSAYINWTLNADNHFWDKTNFYTGFFVGSAEPPNEMWLIKGILPIPRKIIFCPFFRAERPFFVKYPWITGIVQMVYIHGAGIHTSFLFGCNLKIF